ncbi:MAG TPA: hypothetical protein DEG69_12475, partial [Flavobacteriaceae bacterium]|nr:hypothetical protein [Flavobacteriaceae bacterium]
IKYDLETVVKDKGEPTPEFDEERMDIVAQNGNDGLHYEETVPEPTISEQIEKAMDGVQERIKPDLTEVIEPEPEVKKPKLKKMGILGQSLINKKGIVIRPAPQFQSKTDKEIDQMLSDKKQDFDIAIEDGKKLKVPKKEFVQNSEQEISGNWSKIQEVKNNNDQKRIINDEEYHQRLESRVSDLITKIKTGEQTLEQLSEEEQKLVKDNIDNDT